MVSSLASLLIVAAPTFAADADRAITRLTAMKAGTASVSVNSNDGIKREVAQYEVSWDGPSKIVFRMRTPVASGIDATDRTYAISGRSFVGFDATTREVIRRESPTVGTGFQRLSTVLGGATEAVRFFLDPAFPSEFFTPLKSAKDWKLAGSSSSRTWTLAGKRGSTPFSYRLTFNREGLPTAIRMATGGATLDWKLSYPPRRSSSFTVPRNAAPVSAFMQRSAPPKFADREAREIVQLGQRTYDQLRNVEVTVSSNEGTFRLAASGDRLSESGPRVSWAYDGATLVLIDRSRRMAYRSKSGRLGIIERVASVGHQVHALQRTWVLRENALRQLFSPDLTVRSVGRVRIGSSDAVALNVDGRMWKGDLLLRRSDGLLLQTNTRNVDASGRTVSSSRQTFTYGTIGKTLPASRFQLAIPAGFQVKEFPPLVKR